MRMNELNQVSSGVDFHKLILQRHRGLDEVMPGSSQWSISTGVKDECWH